MRTELMSSEVNYAEDDDRIRSVCYEGIDSGETTLKTAKFVVNAKFVTANFCKKRRNRAKRKLKLPRKRQLKRKRKKKQTPEKNPAFNAHLPGPRPHTAMKHERTETNNVRVFSQGHADRKTKTPCG